ncbi:MAG: YCF48-related protein [Pyrinomonadaceae bacterium]|nr:YCF48-related protein [Pyrinomonadaceae bacterium]MCX7638930.1 YCF48-related protein [Pyrinomonadaceae bacterium]MDW8304933.1 YCF48-related protein [Acidobacteriota bacterium]
MSFLLIIPLFLLQVTEFSGWKSIDLKSFAWLRSIHFVNSERGFVVGNKGAFFETVDGGKNWRHKSITDDNILDVYFSDENTGWLLCEKDILAETISYILKTSDGGLSWQKIEFDKEKRRFSKFLKHGKTEKLFVVGESGAFYELYEDRLKKIEIPTLYRITDGFLTADLMILVGGEGLIITSRNTKDWEKAIFNVPPQNRFNAVFFVDEKLGWAVGNRGQIYFTTNGGRLWQKQESNVLENLNDVLFISKKEGFAVGDGGLILQTKDSGASWNKTKLPTNKKLEKLFFVNGKIFVAGFGGAFYSLETSSR